MKQLILIIGLILSISNASSQTDICDIQLNYVTYTNQFPGIEVTLSVENVGTLPVYTAQIFWANNAIPGFNIVSLPSSEWGGYLNPGEGRDIILPNCFDLPYGEHETVFEIISLDNNNTTAGWAYCGTGDVNLSNNSDVINIVSLSETPCINEDGNAYCDECGIESSIPIYFAETILKTEYFTITGQNVPFEELQQNVLYIIKETTPTGFNIYKTIPK